MTSLTLPRLIPIGLLLFGASAAVSATEFSSHIFTYRLDTKVNPAIYSYLQNKESMQEALEQDIREQVANNLDDYNQPLQLALYTEPSEQDSPFTGE